MIFEIFSLISSIEYNLNLSLLFPEDIHLVKRQEENVGALSEYCNGFLFTSNVTLRAALDT
jgi:hypothetical protein